MCVCVCVCMHELAPDIVDGVGTKLCLPLVELQFNWAVDGFQVGYFRVKETNNPRVMTSSKRPEPTGTDASQRPLGLLCFLGYLTLRQVDTLFFLSVI